MVPTYFYHFYRDFPSGSPTGKERGVWHIGYRYRYQDPSQGVYQYGTRKPRLCTHMLRSFWQIQRYILLDTHYLFYCQLAFIQKPSVQYRQYIGTVYRGRYLRLHSVRGLRPKRVGLLPRHPTRWPCYSCITSISSLLYCCTVPVYRVISYMLRKGNIVLFPGLFYPAERQNRSRTFNTIFLIVKKATVKDTDLIFDLYEDVRAYWRNYNITTWPHL